MANTGKWLALSLITILKIKKMNLEYILLVFLHVHLFVITKFLKNKQYIHVCPEKNNIGKN